MDKNQYISELYNELFEDVKCGGLADKYEFMTLTYDLLENEEFLALGNIKHHLHTSRLMHSLHVAYNSYYTCKKRDWDYKSVARGALLHDFFNVGNKNKNIPYRCLLGFCHPKMAMNKSLEHFELNYIEKNCILRHMFPMTIIPPKYKEAWMVILWDKIWGTRECFAFNRKFIVPVVA